MTSNRSRCATFVEGDDMKDTILISFVLGRLMASLGCSVQVAEGESDELEQ